MHISDILQRLLDAGLTANVSKCQFCLPRMEVLGHILANGKIEPSDDKLKAIQAIQPASTKRQVRCLLGLIGYYRQLVPQFAELTYCLTDLLRKEKPHKVKRESKHQQALDKIKHILTSKPVLVPADSDKHYVLQADASLYALGSVLSQVDDNGREHVVTYASRKLLPREINYSTIEKELLAILWSLQHWEHFIYGRHVTVYSDHRPLQWLRTMANQNSRLQRWSLMLEKYDIETVYKRGVENTNCDALSRLDVE